MALENRITAINWQSNVETIKNTALSGKRYVADFGHQYWSFTIQTPPLTREQFQDDFAVLFNNTESATTLDIKPGIFHDANGSVDTTTSPSGAGVLESAARSKGANVIDFELTDTSTAGMSLSFGDFFQFADHKKIYMINTDDASLDPANFGGAPCTTAQYSFFPRLIKQTSTGNVKFNDLSVQVIALGETNSFSTNQNGLFVFEKEVREVF